MKCISSGDFLYPIWIKINESKVFFLFLGFFPIKSHLLSELDYPYRITYQEADFIDRLKYFSVLTCWKNKIRRPVYRIGIKGKKKYTLARMSDRQLYLLRNEISKSI